MAASIFWNGTDHELRCNYLKNEAGSGAPEATYGISFPNGQGLDFSAVAGGGATSSLLDNYEEGTFTPTLYGSTTAGSYTLTVNSANYTVIGNRCFADLDITVASVVSAGTGNAYISGFPTKTASNTTSRGTVHTVGVDWTSASANITAAHISSGATDTLLLLESNDNAAQTVIPITAFSATDRIIISINYIV